MIPFECLKLDFEKFHSDFKAIAGTKPATPLKRNEDVYWAYGDERDAGVAVSEAEARLFAGWQAPRTTWARPDDPPLVKETLDTLASYAQFRDLLERAEPHSAYGWSFFVHREMQLFLSYFEWCLAKERAEHANSPTRVEPAENPQCDTDPERQSEPAATPIVADAPPLEIPIVS